MLEKEWQSLRLRMIECVRVEFKHWRLNNIRLWAIISSLKVANWHKIWSSLAKGMPNLLLIKSDSYSSKLTSSYEEIKMPQRMLSGLFRNNGKIRANIKRLLFIWRKQMITLWFENDHQNIKLKFLTKFFIVSAKTQSK